MTNKNDFKLNIGLPIILTIILLGPVAHLMLGLINKDFNKMKLIIIVSLISVFLIYLTWYMFFKISKKSNQ
ncbi:hypothetical protein FDF31_04230 [Clostridium sporogenes]|uniref:hypothetical protein n=1 Tax=unclassified Clostridium TaxID=2614128 RepID=UPI0013D267F3|nr:hypothetical protein [Clostridium sporogenes]NFS24873.1 hypothetical protein [Clostridium sporogenes]